jgi:hypothetical protein
MKTFKPFALMSGVLLVGGLVLAACGATPPASTAPAATASMQVGSGGEAAQRALEALAQTLNVDPLDVAVVGIEPVQWPDTCLGVNLRDLQCAMQIVPGYKVVLEVHDQQYAYHASEDGSSLVAVPFMILTWKAGDQCQTADLNYDEGIRYGPCNGAMTTASFADSSQLLDLAGFSAKFGPFSAETSVGSLTFFGTGTEATTPVEQRMMSEWARVAAEEAAGAAAGTARGMAISWHREGGVAGYCSDLVVYVTGKVVATSCKGAQPQELGQYFLDAEQLQQLYEWTDTLKPFEMEQTDNATADALTIRVVFYGNGAQEASAADQQAIESFAADLFLQISQEQGASGRTGQSG